jgi:hypothetical protein
MADLMDLLADNSHKTDSRSTSKKGGFLSALQKGINNPQPDRKQNLYNISENTSEDYVNLITYKLNRIMILTLRRKESK